MENYFLIDEIKPSDKRTMIEIALDEWRERYSIAIFFQHID